MTATQSQTRVARREVIGGLAAALGAAATSGCASRLPPAFEARRILDLSDLEKDGRLGFAMLDSGSGRALGWRADERFPYCSTFKLFLAAAILERVQRGRDRLDREIPVSPSDIVEHAPVTGAAVGSALPLAKLAEGAVMVSDNPAANILIRELGGLDAWQQWYRSLGDGVTRVDRAETELNSSHPGDPRDTTTPGQTIANLQSLFAGRRLHEHHLRLLQKWLIETPTGARRIKAGVPAGFITAHKTGTGGNGSTNDIGLVWPPRGSAFYVAAYYTGAVDRPPAEREAVLAEAARRGLASLGVS